MIRPLLLLFLALAISLRSPAQESDAPPIVIDSPEDATTFARGSIKEHSLMWDKKRQLLIAHVIFSDYDETGPSSNDDVHDFPLPGVEFDPVKGIFYARTARGEAIPVAHIRKQLFMKVIEVLPNAMVRIQHPRGRVHVVLEAFKPGDPALASPSQDGSHSIDLHDLIH